MNLPYTTAVRRKANRRRYGALALSAVVLASAAAAGTVASAEAASNISADGTPIDVLLGVGATESQRILSWYTPSTANQSVELEKKSDLTGGTDFNGNKRTIAASRTANGAADSSADPKQSGYSNSHATLLNLAPNTTYSYHVGDSTHWSPTYTFTTQSFTGNFDFLFFGDPQIGSSGNTDKDGAGWAATLNYATTRTPNAELLVSGGDQVESANNEYQWSAFADSSTVLKQYPWAATIGNHDVGGKAYEQHNALPNLSKDTDYYPNGNATDNSGGDYYYIYKGVLFIDLNSNAYSGGSDAAHVNYVSSVIDKVGSKAKWTVLVYHHPIYSPAEHANDTDNQQRRNDFTTAFSDLGVDLVLQGHDHSYSRSYAILNGAKANPDEQPAADQVFAGPGGVIYVTANSASGSKYYDLTAADASKAGYGADPLDPTGKRHFANSVENQEHVRTYVQVSVTDDKLNVSDIRAGDCTAPNAAVELNKVSTCGIGLNPTASATPGAIGSTVDKFSLYSALPAVTTTVVASQSSTVAGSSTPITLTATVVGGLGTLTGTVGFYDGGSLVGSVPVSGGTASLTLPATPAVGTHAYTAKFTTGSAFTGTNSASAATSVDVVKATSTTTLKYAKGVATVTVTAPALTAAGSATIYDGTKVVGTVTVVNGSGTAKVTLSTSGTHTLTAVFAGTDAIAPSTSSVVSVKIAKSTTSISYSKKKVTVTVKASGVATSKVDGSAKLYDGKKVLKTVSIVNGKSTDKVSLKKGTHKLHAVFALTNTIAASTSKTISVKIK